MSSDVISSWQFHQPKSMVIMVISQRLPPFNWSSTWVELGYQMIQMLPPASAEEGTVLPKWNSLRFRTSTEHGTSKEEGRNSFWMWTCLERRETRWLVHLKMFRSQFVSLSTHWQYWSIRNKPPTCLRHVSIFSAVIPARPTRPQVPIGLTSWQARLGVLDLQVFQHAME
jgi:hypothetical protein